MSQSKITLIGIENYLNPEESLFDSLVLPEGIDKEVLAGSIMMRCQEFELLYSDPDFLKVAVNLWSRKHYRTFDKWVKALEIEYDPLYNYDRTEEYTDTHKGSFDNKKTGSGSGTTSQSSDHTRTDNLSQSDDHTTTDDHTMTDNLTQTITHSEKAYNSGTTMVDTTQDVDGHSGTQRTAGTSRTAGTVSNTGTQRTAGTDSGTFSNSSTDNENGTDNYTNTHKARLFGNIGVTTSQQMLLSELNDAARWNLYEHIADLFCQEFCIMVY